jgi:CTP synthase (UTP-ammonia lyase)
MSAPVKIGIVGDFTPEYRSHQAINASLEHSAKRLMMDIEVQWVPTPRMLERGSEELLESFDGLWAASGSPYKSFQGMLNGIQFARSRDWPFVGT